MSLRLRLALALLLLSALPLAGLALYSHATSSAALRKAAEVEANALARELAQRVGATATEVDLRVRQLARLPLESWSGTGEEERERVEAALAGLGPALPWIEGLTFVPRAPEAPAAPAAVAPVAWTPPAPATAATPAVAPVAPVAPVPAPAPPAARGHAGFDTRQREALRLELELVRESIARTIAETRAVERQGDAAPQLLLALEAQRRAERELDRLAAPGGPFGPVPSPPAAPAPAPAAPAPPPSRGPIDGSVSCPIESGDQEVGRLTAKIKAEDLLRSVLAQTDRAQGEIPFALDAEGKLYVASAEDGDRLRDLPALAELRAGAPAPEGASPAPAARGDWVVVSRRDEGSGYRYGIARPLSAAMTELKRATARNFSFGMLLVGLAIAGLYPVSGRLVRDVHLLEQGAARLAEGDLGARVEVSSRHELGRLAATFNHMAGELAENQRRLLEQERLRKEEEIDRRLLAAENERRRRELEEAREFQLSLLPRELPRRAALDLAVSMTTATEVGGDYYDFLDADDGALVVAVGDATGHGAAAGTLVTAIKGLFAGSAAAAAPAAFLAAANAAVHRMGLVRRAMALAVARVAHGRVTISAAGMPPALHFEAATGEVHEVALAGTPLGARAGFPYAEATVELAQGDALLFLSDGLPELPNAEGEPYGYERLARRFGDLAGSGPDARCVIAGLEATTAEWSRAAAPADDVTFLVLRAI
jgi:serine phosphatase RsbU (regulator of sigma subunit)